MPTLFTPQFVRWLQTKNVTDSSGHEHDEGSGQFTGTSGGGKPSVDEVHSAYSVSGKLDTPNSKLNAAIRAIGDMGDDELSTLAGKMNRKLSGNTVKDRKLLQTAIAERRGAAMRSEMIRLPKGKKPAWNDEPLESK